MALSQEIVSQFAKLVTKNSKTKTESTIYGKVVVDSDGNKYVKPDGSDQLIPLSNDENPVADSTTATTAKVNEGERVSVLIKNHTATVTGNVSSPAARTGDVKDLGDQVSEIQEFDILIGQQVKANEGYIKKLQADKANVSELTAANAKITELEATKATVEELNAAKAEITDLKANKLDVDVANIKYATVEKLDVITADVTDLKADNATIQEAVIKDLTAEDGSIKNLDVKYANIDFTNIGEAAIKNFYATSGVIQDVVISDGHVTGTLVGVTIKGSLIEGGTVVADKLVIKGEDGLYYKLNTLGINANSQTNYVKMDTVVTPDEGNIVEGAFTADDEQVYSYNDASGNTAYYTIVDGVYYEVMLSSDSVKVEQTDYNSLNGSIITAKSITATQISVDDLVAFDATIAGFNIVDNSLYSGVKATVDNATTGVYMDSDAQFAVGGGTNFFKFYKDDNDNYRLEISASSVVLSNTQTNIETELNDTVDKLTETSDNLSQEIENQKSDFQAFKTKFSKYIRFMEDENGDPSDTAITIGSGDSAITLELDNEIGIVFKKNGVQFGWWDGVDFHTGNIVVEVNERAQFGNFAYVPRSDGSLSFLKVGG